ncbi:MAG TPA: hypothetical protein QF572_16000 [Vicinamibacterales bacterium]|nr:hypothetical protein [Vicinamibacterales bacterium]
MTTATLERTMFSTKRVMEFFSVKELNMQLGQSRAMWPIALLKELLDNALDAAELAGVTPSVGVTLTPDAFSVQDNGPGLPEETLVRSLDYLVRVSDKNYYISPTRGQLGNALKCVWAAPFVADGNHGQVDVTTGGVRHEIAVRLDRIAQEPDVRHTRHPDRTARTGTRITIHWPGIASYEAPDRDDAFLQMEEDEEEIASYQDRDESPIFLQMLDLVHRFALFNPHAMLTVKQPKTKPIRWTPTDTAWRKWQPDRPTSPHWYDPGRLRALIAAYLANEGEGGRARTAREFVSEFAGLRGSGKQHVVTTAAGLSKGAYLHDLVTEDDIALKPVARLLAAMQEASRPITPAALGTIGREHLAARLEAAGLGAESIQYKKVLGVDKGVPFVVEIAFGIHEDRSHVREVTVGLNWSPALHVPVAELSTFLGTARVDPWDPVTMLVHIACPRFEWTDRGKSAVAV